MTNIAVFVSGNGTNCENIIKYFQDDNDINISLVISNRQDAYALKRAAKYGVTCKVLSVQVPLKKRNNSRTNNFANIAKV